MSNKRTVPTGRNWKKSNALLDTIDRVSSAEYKLLGDVKMEIIEEGTGPIPRVGNNITCHYTGKFEDGKVFDSSHNRNMPFQFIVGLGNVIAGWDKAFLNMKEGTKAKLTIPPHLGYGDKHVGHIPANSTLIFEVELIKVGE